MDGVGGGGGGGWGAGDSTVAGQPKGPQVEVAVPPQVRDILVRRCYACHSDEPQLAWWDHVVPVYWVVASDVQRARAVLNFSELGTKPVAAQRAELYEAVNQIQLGAMPLRLYLLGHPHAGVTAEELAVLKNYLAPFKPGSGPSGDGRGCGSEAFDGAGFAFAEWGAVSAGVCGLEGGEHDRSRRQSHAADYYGE